LMSGTSMSVPSFSFFARFSSRRMSLCNYIESMIIN
jgi:hypothetical protein